MNTESLQGRSLPSAELDRVRDVPILDALRGLAILGVIAVHVHTSFHPASPWLDALAAQGGWGVQLFFILSALTLLISWHARHETDAIFRFLLRRFFRVAPLFYVAIGLSALILGTAPRYYAPQGVGIGTFITTALFLHVWHPTAINSVVIGGWSIGDEFNFYLLFPLLTKWVTNLERAYIAFGLATLFGGLLTGLFLYVGHTTAPDPSLYLLHAYLLWWPPSQLPVFLLGFIVYFLAFGSALPDAVRLGHRMLGLVAVACVGLAFLHVGSAVYFPYAIVFAVGVWGALLASPKPLTHPVLIHIGRVSYSAYFVHFYVIGFVLARAAGFLPVGDMGFCLRYLAVVTLTIALSTLTYRFIETPGIALGRRIAARLTKQPS